MHSPKRRGGKNWGVDEIGPVLVRWRSAVGAVRCCAVIVAVLRCAVWWQSKADATHAPQRLARGWPGPYLCQPMGKSKKKACRGFWQWENLAYQELYIEFSSREFCFFFFLGSFFYRLINRSNQSITFVPFSGKKGCWIVVVCCLSIVGTSCNGMYNGQNFK